MWNERSVSAFIELFASDAAKCNQITSESPAIARAVAVAVVAGLAASSLAKYAKIEQRVRSSDDGGGGVDGVFEID